MSWVVAQWWAGYCSVGTCSISVVPLGIVIKYNEQTITPPVASLRQLDDLHNWGDWSTHPRFNGAFHGNPNTYYSSGFKLPGMVYAELPYHTRVAIHHWLIVTAVVLVYGVLKCVYWKRAKQPDAAS